MQEIEKLKREIAELKNGKLNFKVYDNRSGGNAASTVNNNARTQEIIMALTESKFTSFMIYIHNHNESNEVIWVYDMGGPYIIALKMSYYSQDNKAPQMILYRHTTAGWSAPQTVNTSNV